MASLLQDSAPASPSTSALELKPVISSVQTQGSAEVRDNGTPRVYFSAETPGQEPGFPVYVDVLLDHEHLASSMVYMEDSNYMDARSKGVSVQMAVYNPRIKAFGACPASA